MEVSIGLRANATSSQTGTFYFAYGSNLSPEQMAGRCPESPATSSIPVAIARLDGWRWIICGRGYANVVSSSTRSLPSGAAQNVKSKSESESETLLSQEREHDQHRHPATAPASDAEPKPDSPAAVHEDDDSVVWGLIYNLTPASESVLDGYEGYHAYRNPTPTPNPSPDADEVRRRPFLQGGCDYNKLYLPVRVTKWLQDPASYGVGSGSYAPGVGSKSETADQAAERETEITALVYVDEFRTSPGPVKREYVGRMNRAIRQSIELGIPRGWVERVMRRWIVEEVEVGERGDLGRSDGFWV